VINPANDKRYTVKFTVIENDFVPILGSTACQKMCLETGNTDNVVLVKAVHSAEDFITDIRDMFDENDVGTHQGIAHLEVDATILPVVSAPKRVTVALKARVKVKLVHLDLAEQDIITPVSEPLYWVTRLRLAQPQKCIHDLECVICVIS